LPVVWSPGKDPKHLEANWAVPAYLRGRAVLFQFDAASPAVEPLLLKMAFTTAGKHPINLSFRPIVYGGGGKEFLAMRLPANTDKCWVRVDFKKDKEVTLSGFRAVFDETE